jgi:hypothetical protein
VRIFSHHKFRLLLSSLTTLITTKLPAENTTKITHPPQKTQQITTNHHPKKIRAIAPEASRIISN